MLQPLADNGCSKRFQSMPDRPLSVTLREVARAAGVSTASASRALARPGGVSPDLRGRILAAAERLGYAPNFAARSLAARRSGLIGVIVKTLAEPHLADILTALERRLAAAGYGLVIVATEGASGPSLTSALQRLLGRGAEGLVLADTAHARELLPVLRSRRLPWIVIADEAVGGELSVDGGRRRGAELACRYLLDLGHRRFGVIALAAATAAGVADALAGGGLAGTAPVHDADAAQAAMQRLLDQRDPPTAVICDRDLYALAAVRACLGQGVAVPRAVSIIGFGDADFARRAVPALTTLRIPSATVGVHLADSLLACLEDGTPPPGFAAPVKLVVRESTGPAPR
jgi:LacI family transcriptional regulator